MLRNSFTVVFTKSLQKRLAIILIPLLLIFSVQNESYSREVQEVEDDALVQETIDGLNSSNKNPGNQTKKPLSAAEIRERILPSVVLILAGDSSGSGVLFEAYDEFSYAHEFILTNEHITRGKDAVEVYFAAYDITGKVIQEPAFYENRVILEQLGYISKGRVVSENREADLAIIRLESAPPKTARAITATFDEPEVGEAIHYLGHPGNRELLWQSGTGHYRASFGGSLSLDAGGTWHGNSGGPVVNKKGELIGLIKTTDKETKTSAVSMKAISDLMNNLEIQQIFWITNDTESQVKYEIKWLVSDSWETYTLESEAKPVAHVRPEHQIPFGYPKIRFIADQQKLQTSTNPDNVESTQVKDKTDEKVQYTEQVLRTKYQFFGKDVNERIVPALDGYNYRFMHNTESKQIQLHEQRETVWIANHTYTRWACEIEWAGDSPNTPYILEPGTARPHWNPISAKARQPYPQIRIKWKGGHDPDGTERLVEVKKKNLITNPEFFPILYAKGPERFSAVRDAEVKHIQTDSRKFIRGKHSSVLVNYYYLEESRENGILEIHHGYYISALSTEKVQRRGWRYWVPLVGLAVVLVIVLRIMQITFKRLKQRDLLMWFRKNDE